MTTVLTVGGIGGALWSDDDLCSLAGQYVGPIDRIDEAEKRIILE